MMIEKIRTFGIGAAGYLGIDNSHVLAQITPHDVSNYADILTKLAVAVAAVIGIFKKKKKQ